VSEAVEPFDIAVPEAELDDLRRRLAETRWPDREVVRDWSQGAPLDVVQNLVRYWRDGYDWRATERRLNELPQYRTTIDGLPIHFVHLRSVHADAVPVVLTHGWPGSFLEFEQAAQRLIDPAAGALACHVVVPSLPGYAFSGRPTEPGWTIHRIADVWCELMTRLGYDRFVAAGGTFVDTADVYSAGVSEQIIGRWFAQRPADVTEAVVLATKGRFPTGDAPNSSGLSARHLTRALDASLRRLGLDSVDLYQVHAFDPHTPLDETIRTLDGFVRAGKIRYWGFSNFTGWQLTKAVHLARELGAAAPVTLQPQYSLLVREIEWEIVPAAMDAGLGLLPWSPLGGGYLSGKYRKDQRPSGATRLGEDPGRGMEAWERRGTDRTWAVIAAVQEVAEARGVSMAEVALAWVTNRPGVTSTILGARTVEQLETNLRAADLRLEEAELARLDAASDLHATDYPYGELGIDQRSRSLSDNW